MCLLPSLGRLHCSLSVAKGARAEYMVVSGSLRGADRSVSYRFRGPEYYSWTVAERLDLSIGPFPNIWVWRWVLGPAGLLANCSYKRTGAKYKTLLEFPETQMGVSPVRFLCQPDCSQAMARTSWSRVIGPFRTYIV